MGKIGFWQGCFEELAFRRTADATKQKRPQARPIKRTV
jgi:hypothetical protein